MTTKLSVTSPITGEVFTRKTDRAYVVCRIEHIPAFTTAEAEEMGCSPTHPGLHARRRASWHTTLAHAQKAFAWSRRSTVFEYLDVV